MLGELEKEVESDEADKADESTLDDAKEWLKTRLSKGAIAVATLIGEAKNYSLGVSPHDLQSGTGIFFNDSTTQELIGIVADVLPENLSLNNISQFTFV